VEQELKTLKATKGCCIAYSREKSSRSEIIKATETQQYTVKDDSGSLKQELERTTDVVF
jgi:hypothetical protein